MNSLLNFEKQCVPLQVVPINLECPKIRLNIIYKFLFKNLIENFYLNSILFLIKLVIFKFCWFNESNLFLDSSEKLTKSKANFLVVKLTNSFLKFKTQFFEFRNLKQECTSLDQKGNFKCVLKFKNSVVPVFKKLISENIPLFKNNNWQFSKFGFEKTNLSMRQANEPR